MTGVAAGPASRHDARALRFLLLLFGCWTIARVAAHWNPAVPLPPHPAAVGFASEPGEPRWAPIARIDDRAMPEFLSAGPTERRRRQAGIVRLVQPAAPSQADAASWGDGLNAMRSAMLVRLLPPLPGGTSRAAVAGPAWVKTETLPYPGPPGAGRPYWMKRQLAGWSLGSWAYLRSGSGRVPDGGIAAASQLGGSQASARLAYGFGESGRLRAYGRVTLALAEVPQRELALGLAFAPLAHVPVDIAVEQRVAAGSEGRTALAAMVVGGVGDVALPARFRLDAYGQAGIVGARRRDGFADAAVVIDREVARTPGSSLHLGGLAVGSVQPGAARVDVGPRVTLRLPKVGEGSRVALDWRQRVAGDARPDSGVALTLAADF
ncbi:hypothetical protein BWQ93_12760 [Sphingopyxis sp. QXT-31]|nr:hypothetical protein BWQ93_12760 [Sphingopyxis sp. QXT-31]